MSTLKTTLTGYLGYRGRTGHWSFLLHRITGLGTLLFLAIHILDTAMVHFNPTLYMEVIGIYRTTLVGIMEIGLVFCVLFHGMNGLRIAIFDLFTPRNWTIPSQQKITLWTLAATLVIWIPAVVIMVGHMLAGG